MFVTAFADNRVAVLTSLSSTTTSPGTEMFSFTETSPPLNGIQAIALDGDGNMYIVNEYENCISVLASIHSTTPGMQIAVITDTTGTPLNNAIGVALDSLGQAYVTDANNYRVVVLAGLAAATPGEELFSFNFSLPAVADPDTFPNEQAALWRITLDPDGNIFGAVTAANAIAVLSSLSSTQQPPGTLLFTFTDPTTPLSMPTNVALDSAGRLLVADTLNQRVVILTSIPSVSPAPGSEVAAFTDPPMGLLPIGVAFDSVGRMYVVDDQDDRVAVLEALPAAAALGDPQFHGFLGQSYQVHGLDGEVYSILSSATLQVNARFVFLKEGVGPTYGGINTPKARNCWSHLGSYFGALAFRTSNNCSLLLSPGSSDKGFSSIALDGKSLLSFAVEAEHSGSAEAHRCRGAGDSDSDGLHVVIKDRHHVAVQHGLFTFSVDSSDLFLNLADVQVSQWSQLVKTVQPHGLLGQSWKCMEASNLPASVAVIEGEVDDYIEADGDLFGHNTLHNRFQHSNHLTT